MKLFTIPDEGDIKQIDFSAAMIEKAALVASGFGEDDGDDWELDDIPDAPATAEDVDASGARFVIPLVLPEGVPSGDGRMFLPGSLTMRDLPLPLMWQVKTGPGHDGSVIVGRIDSVDRVEDGLGNARGVFDTGTWGREAERLVRNLFLRGISGDLDEFSASSDKGNDNDELSDKESIKNRKVTIDRARLMGVTLVAKPAFQECFIMIDNDPIIDFGEDEPVEDGLYEDGLDDIDNELAALAASAAPIIPPRSWFQNPELDGPTPLTIDDDGRVFGHIATWKTKHIGYGRKAPNPPHSASNYAYFRTGVVRTEDGTDVPVGQLTLAGGHASMHASAADAVKHYDDTASAVADVSAGEDRHGIWVAGSLRPDVTPSQVRALRASAPSGDWRPINGRLELVAVCQVNVPGFPNVRAMVAGGQVTALVAAGARPLAEMREESKLVELEQRLMAVEGVTFATKAQAARDRMAALGAFPAEPVEEEEVDLEALAASARSRMEAHAPSVSLSEQASDAIARLMKLRG